MGYGGYGKPDPYSEYMSRGAYAPPPPAGGGMGLEGALGIAGLGLNVLGTAAGAYGAYKQYQQAERMRKEENRRYEEEKRYRKEQDTLTEKERRKQEEERRLARTMGYGGYARDLEDGRRQAYQGYAARVGL
jgi:hypothetical protein